MTKLVLAPASHEAAKYAVTRWHYAGVLPSGKLVKYGVWEDDTFIGVVIFSPGASARLGGQFGLDHTELCELTRVALTTHKSPVSQIVAQALKMLKASNPGLRVVVSFADPVQGHKGGVYQAGNWIYTGETQEQSQFFINGRWMHNRGGFYHPDRKTGMKRTVPPKHRYVYPLDKAMRRLVLKMATDPPQLREP